MVDTKVKTRLVGDLQIELVEDFFEGFARGARANVHVKTMYGRSNHHKIEAIFKAFARALRVACSRDKQLGEMLPSHQGPAVIAYVIDYKAGNLTSVMKALAASEPIAVTDGRPRDRRRGGADRAAGRGPFCRDGALDETRAEACNSRERIARGVPFLGICVGMQWLFAGSTEAPDSAGPGRIRRESARAFPKATEGAARGLELARVRDGSRLLAGVARAALSTSRTPIARPVTDDTVGSYELCRGLRGRGRARQRDGRAVPSGKIRRGGAADAAQFSGGAAC